MIIYQQQSTAQQYTKTYWDPRYNKIHPAEVTIEPAEYLDLHPSNCDYCKNPCCQR
jgi:hypothetical protein